MSDKFREFNDRGQLLGTYSFQKILKIKESTPGAKTFSEVNITPNGELLVMFGIKDDFIYIFKSPQNWGHPYQIWGSQGITEAEAAVLGPEILDMNNGELKMIENCFWAVQGYDFPDWESKAFFNGYPWYQPQPGVKKDPTALTPNQRRLYDLVVQEQQYRISLLPPPPPVEVKPARNWVQ